MSVTIDLLPGVIQLIDASTAEDSSAHVRTHNINMNEIEKWIHSYKIAIAAIATVAGGTTDTNTLETLIQSAKKQVTLPINMIDGTSVIDSNGFKVERIGIPTGGTTDSLEYRITDTDATRNTNFENIIPSVKLLTGRIVYPTLIANLTNLRVVFAHNSELNSTPSYTGPTTTDPNVKLITFI